MKNISACLSHNTDNWATPKKLYSMFIDHNYFDVCPFSLDKPKFDGLSIQWPSKVFCNPPYSEISKWVDKAILEMFEFNHCKDIYFLIPSRTDTKYFEKLFSYCSELYFIKGRLHFNDSKLSAPFPSVLIHLHKYTMFKLDYPRTFISSLDDLIESFKMFDFLL